MEELEKMYFKREFLDNWHHNYQKFETFCKGQGSPGEMDIDLSRWVDTQRNIRHLLPKELKEKLRSVGFDFEEPHGSWESMYQQLFEYVKHNGHAFLPADQEYEMLKDWLIRQIINKRLLSEDQLQKLNRLEIDWNMALSRDQRWELMYLSLLDFYKVFNHCRVPQNWHFDKQLALWVKVQRRRHGHGKLLKDRERKLEELNFVWNIKTVFDSQWQECFQELGNFIQMNGHCRVPGRNKKLVSWIERQRLLKANSQLPPDREKMLDELNFIWNFKEIKRRDWEEKFKELKIYTQKNGHSFVPVNYKENKALGTWVATQRWLEAKGKLGQVKKRKLSELGFVWSRDTHRSLRLIYTSHWEASFEKLKTYKKSYGTCQVSLKIDPVLQRWTSWQRKAFYEGKLSQGRLDRLNEIRFPWSIQEGYWMKMYDALADFKNQFGHTRVPYRWSKNPNLSAWVYRTMLGTGSLIVQ